MISTKLFIIHYRAVRHTSRTKCASLAKHTSRSAQAEHIVQKTKIKSIISALLSGGNTHYTERMREVQRFGEKPLMK